MTALSNSLSNTGSVPDGTYEELFVIPSTGVSAKGDTTPHSINFKATTISFTTSVDNSVLVLTAPSGNSKRLIALDSNITSQSAQSSSWTDTASVKKLSETTTFTISSAGTHYISFDNSDHKLSAISLTEPGANEDSCTISSIDATVTGGVSKITISNPELSIVGSTNKVTDFNYSVYLDDSTDAAEVTNGEIAATAGTHKVTIKYGTYTVAVYDNIEVTSE